MPDGKPAMPPASCKIDSCAIVVDPGDDVAVVKYGIEPGTAVETAAGGVVRIAAAIAAGGRFALRDVAAGQPVLQYGQPIGTSRGIHAGDAVTAANLDGSVPVVRDLPADLHNPAPDYVPPAQRPTFCGFRRPDGRVGTRNFVLVVPTSMCASHEATQIAMLGELTLLRDGQHPAIDGISAIPHNKGCGCNDGSNVDVLLRTLANFAAHPNVGGVVFIDLGCEKTNLTLLDRYLRDRGGLGWDKPSAWIGIQEAGGTKAAIDRGLQAVADMLPVVGAARREELSVEHLVLGLECGGSDAFSGISANPSLGNCADRLVRCGGTALLSEVPEFCGAEHLLARRAKDAATGHAVYALVDWFKAYAATAGARLDQNPSPGNLDGGLLNITIKSLGAIAKGGTTRVEGTTDYAVPPQGRGLQLMQGPGYDQESVPGLVAAGANVVVFTTGRGSTLGNAIAPVIKLATNSRVFERMPGDLDLSAGGVVDGTETIDEVGGRVFEYVRRVAGGEVRCKAEETGHREFQVWAERAVSL